jgi:hypothetical protein
LENNELGSLAGAIGSGAVGLYGFLSQSPYIGSVFIVVMTVSFTYFFNARIQSSAREYERRRLQTTEVLGPVYGQVTRNIEQMEKKRAALSLDLGPAAGNEWDAIEHSYRVELIDGKLRSDIGLYFLDLDRLQNLMGLAVETLRRIEKDVWATMFGPQPGNDGGHLYYLIDDYRHERYGRVYDAVFWEKDPTKQFNMKWKGLAVTKARGEPNGNPILPEKDEVPGIMSKFLHEAGARASKSLEIVNARAEYERILKEGYDLRERLQKLISLWAKP